MAEIKLSNGRTAIVDDADLPLVASRRWYMAAKKYAMTRINGERVYMHRLITGAGVGQEVDHLSGDGLDNRRANLRLCSHRSNLRAMNRRARGLSRFRGVTFDKSKRKWAAKITVDGKTINLGRFGNESDAAEAYRSAALTHFGPDYRQEAYDAA